jgi:hypothetical protein
VYLRRFTPLFAAVICLSAQIGAGAQWTDVAPAQQPQQQFEGQPIAAPPAAQASPNIQQLLKQASKQFDPSRESPEAYMQRMNALQEQFKTYEAQQQQAKLDPPIKRLPPGTLLPGMSTYQVEHPFSANPNDPGFFNGITPEQAAAGLQMELPNKAKQNVSPSWAKQKPSQESYVDGVQHFGNEDEMGFIH